jgi:hypothetical protein
LNKKILTVFLVAVVIMFSSVLFINFNAQSDDVEIKDMQPEIELKVD